MTLFTLGFRLFFILLQINQLRRDGKQLIIMLRSSHTAPTQKEKKAVFDWQPLHTAWKDAVSENVDQASPSTRSHRDSRTHLQQVHSDQLRTVQHGSYFHEVCLSANTNGKQECSSPPGNPAPRKDTGHPTASGSKSQN